MDTETSSGAARAVSFTNQDKALRELDKALNKEPSNLQAIYFRALIWSAKQEWAKAVADYEIATRLSPGDPSLWYNCGIAAWHGGDQDKAEECLTEARRLDPSCEGAHYHLAVLQAEKGRIMEALSLAQKALELRPTECSIGIEEFVDLIDRLEARISQG